ncbi:MAG TPA: hypothetical protein PLZ08_12985 [Bacillota bacterium]|nr:hypothetical protein [Bacillota bacterium]HOL11140.1 hypothetical protein [Bacillota bacterium]HPO98854.1 hypothetical protein [Bacillota bacterium]
MKRSSVTQSFITGLLLIVLLIGVIGCGGSSRNRRGPNPIPDPKPNPITRYFAYVANYDSNNISAYTINPTIGALTPIGASVATGSKPYSIVTVKVTTP